MQSARGLGGQRVEPRAELEPAGFERVDLVADLLQALALLGTLRGREAGGGHRAFERVAIVRQHAHALVDAVELPAQGLEFFRALLPRGRGGDRWRGRGVALALPVALRLLA